jgi:Arc/MetJ-type ribon-helix-helix transcriptional regulator
MELPHALEARINELVKSGFYSNKDEFIIEAVRLHLQSQKFKEFERLSERWIHGSYWPFKDIWSSNDTIPYYGFPPGKTSTTAGLKTGFHL